MVPPSGFEPESLPTTKPRCIGQSISLSSIDSLGLFWVFVDNYLLRRNLLFFYKRLFCYFLQGITNRNTYIHVIC